MSTRNWSREDAKREVSRLKALDKWATEYDAQQIVYESVDTVAEIRAYALEGVPITATFNEWADEVERLQKELIDVKENRDYIGQNADMLLKEHRKMRAEVEQLRIDYAKLGKTVVTILAKNYRVCSKLTAASILIDDLSYEVEVAAHFYHEPRKTRCIDPLLKRVEAYNET